MGESLPSDPPASVTPARRRLWMIAPFVPILLALAIAFGISAARRGGATPATRPALAVDKLAPDFSLVDAHAKEGDEPVTLSILTQKSPVLIFYYFGYSCPRCVGYLQQLSERKADFARAGIQIIAISPDTPANTRDSIHLYGDFDFPLLYDRDMKVARVYGLLDANDQLVSRGTFLVDKNRRIQFSYTGEDAYSDFDQLIELGNKLSGK